ncbi:MAG: hypothetical protein ACTSX6_02145 [Candidatus Heimdallarchaeaceae archaeon]
MTSKNFIVPCPWCEYPEDKDHYHMYISIEAPIFHCFHASCEQKGNLRKFLRKIQGHDISDTFIDKKALDEAKKRQKVFEDKEVENSDIFVPKIEQDKFLEKNLYFRKRMKFFNVFTSLVKGLIFDINKFIDLNQIPVGEKLFRIRDYLHSNFIGFLTDNNSTVIMRNIDDSHDFRFYKLKIQETNFLDYYKLQGNDFNSNTIVLGEGIFDIFGEHNFDTINIKDKVKLYASSLSANYTALIKSIVFHEQIFRPDVIILSDRGIPKYKYHNLKKYNSHIINSLTVYYNKVGKDFGDTTVFPMKFII